MPAKSVMDTLDDSFAVFADWVRGPGLTHEAESAAAAIDQPRSDESAQADGDTASSDGVVVTPPPRPADGDHAAERWRHASGQRGRGSTQPEHWDEPSVGRDRLSQLAGSGVLRDHQSFGRAEAQLIVDFISIYEAEGSELFDSMRSSASHR